MLCADHVVVSSGYGWVDRLSIEDIDTKFVFGVTDCGLQPSYWDIILFFTSLYDEKTRKMWFLRSN